MESFARRYVAIGERPNRPLRSGFANSCERTVDSPARGRIDADSPLSQ